MLFCGDCGGECESLAALSTHYSDIHSDLDSFKCGFCPKRFVHKNSMIRHWSSYHGSNNEDGPSTHQGLPPRQPPRHPPQQPPLQPSGPPSPADNASPAHSPPPEATLQETVDDAAVDLLVNLRSTASLTGKAIERFENGCNQMLQDYSLSLKAKVEARLQDRGFDQEDVDNLLNGILVQNPFRNLKTIDDQLNCFKEKFGLTVPDERYLDHRVDRRLDPKSNSYVPKQVNETFQSVQITDTLKSILSNEKMRERVFQDLASHDGKFRSHADGYHFKTHPFLQRHKEVFYILLYYDELEIANALGSKTIIHKLGAFFFQILNLPAAMSSELSSIFLLALVHADDMKKTDAFKKVLTPFIQEMKKLSSEEGVTVVINNQEHVMRAVLTAFTADSLAAHDLLGFVGPGARHFCRKCMVSRNVVRADANAMGIPRTPDLHEYHLQQVARRSRFSTECGVKRSCPLDEIPFFTCVENGVFDAFHDILEGIGPLVLKLVLREYIVVRKLFTVKDLNGNVASFSYGLPDSKNKPSPNFTTEMFLKKCTNIKQTGSQMWCLIRSLPFLINDFLGEEVDAHMQLIFLLQNLMQIIFSFEISCEDIDHLETLITQHNAMFEDLFIKPQIVDVDVDELDDPEEAGDGADNIQEEDRQQIVPVPQFNVHVINKLHHIKHYGEMIRQYGDPVRMWCAKFEGRLKIFRQHSSVCCNFKNTPLTMAKMFQLSNVKSIRCDLDDRIEHHKGTSVRVSNSQYSDLLGHVNLAAEEVVTIVKSVTVNGEEYQSGLFVCLPGSTPRQPSFGLIQEAIVTCHRSVIFIVAPWKVLDLSPRFNTYRVCPEDDMERQNLMAVEVMYLAHFRCIAAWPTRNHEVHLSLRTVLV